MDVRSTLSIGASMLTVGFGCAVLASVSWGGGDGAPVSTASPSQSVAVAVPLNASPAATKSDSLKSEDLKKLSVVKELAREPGLLDRRVRLSGGNPEAPISAPPNEPGMTRRDYLRLKDRVEAKENWMFVDQDKIKSDREKSTQDDVFKDKWERKQDLKKREWWEYGSKNSTTASSASLKETTDPSQMDEETRAQVARRLHDEDSKSRDNLPRARRNSTDSAGGTHQFSALSMKDLFQPGSDSKTGRGSELGLSELFGSNSRIAGDRESGSLRRQEFRDFLNVSRVPRSAIPVDSSASASSSALGAISGRFSDPLQTGTRPSGRESLGASPELGRGAAAGFGNYYDPNRSGGFGPQANNNPSFRNLEPSRNLITPSMLEPPKRRF